MSRANDEFLWADSNAWSSANTPFTDGASLSVRISTNAAPTLANPIPDQSAVVGTAFSYAFPDTTFSDADTGDTLAYAATKADDAALPTWLSFDADTRTFSGMPASTDTGTVSVKVTASDGDGGSISDEFDITVVPALTVSFEVFCSAFGGRQFGGRAGGAERGAGTGSYDHAFHLYSRSFGFRLLGFVADPEVRRGGDAQGGDRHGHG